MSFQRTLNEQEHVSQDFQDSWNFAMTPDNHNVQLLTDMSPPQAATHLHKESNRCRVTVLRNCHLKTRHQNRAYKFPIEKHGNILFLSLRGVGGSISKDQFPNHEFQKVHTYALIDFSLVDDGFHFLKSKHPDVLDFLSF